jgi:hypothetical protein
MKKFGRGQILTALFSCRGPFGCFSFEVMEAWNKMVDALDRRDRTKRFTKDPEYKKFREWQTKHKIVK